MMKSLFKNICIVGLTIVLAVTVLSIVSTIQGKALSFSSYLLGLVVGGGQAFIPFLIFFSVYDRILTLMSARGIGFSALLYIQFSIAMFLLVIAISLVAVFDIMTGYSITMKDLSKYLFENSLFIVFVPLAAIINYFIRKRRT